MIILGFTDIALFIIPFSVALFAIAGIDFLLVMIKKSRDYKHLISKLFLLLVGLGGGVIIFAIGGIAFLTGGLASGNIGF